MTEFCTITPTRGDRPELLAFCKKQIERMDPAPDTSYFIDYAPRDRRGRDLTERVRTGVERAKADGFEIAYILEDDDFYPANYFGQMDIGNYQFIGCDKSVYYNLRNTTWEVSEHMGRSSLFNTGFRISALNAYKWPSGDYVFLDLDLWKYAQSFKRKLLPATVGIGIKHNIGIVGGKGHKAVMRNKDPHLVYLKVNVDEEAYQFYQQFKQMRLV